MDAASAAKRRVLQPPSSASVRRSSALVVQQTPSSSSGPKVATSTTRRSSTVAVKAPITTPLSNLTAHSTVASVPSTAIATSNKSRSRSMYVGSSSGINKYEHLGFMSTPQPTNTLRSLNELFHNFKYETNPKKSKALKSLLALAYKFIERLGSKVKNKREAPLVSKLYLTNRLKHAFQSIRQAVFGNARDRHFMQFIRLKMVFGQVASRLEARLKAKAYIEMSRRVGTIMTMKRVMRMWSLYLDRLVTMRRHKSDVAIQHRLFVATRTGYLQHIRKSLINFKLFTRRQSACHRHGEYAASYCLQSKLYHRRMGKHLLDGFYYYRDLSRRETRRYDEAADYFYSRAMNKHLHLWRAYRTLLARGRKRATTIATMSGVKDYSVFYDYLPRVLKKLRIHALGRSVGRHTDKNQTIMYEKYTVSIAFSVLRANNKMDEHTLHYCSYWRKRLRGKAYCKSALIMLRSHASKRIQRIKRVRRKLKALLEKYVPQRLSVWKSFVSNRVYFVTRHMKKAADHHFLRRQFWRLGAFYARVTQWIERVEEIKNLLELRYSFSLVTARIQKEITSMKIARYYVIRKYAKVVVDFFVQNVDRSHHNKMSQYKGWKEFKSKNCPVYFRKWRRWKSMKKFSDKKMIKKVKKSALHFFRIAMKKWKLFRTRVKQRRYQAYLYQNEVIKFFLARWKDAAKVGPYETYKVKVVRQLDRKKRKALLPATLPPSDASPELTRAFLKRKYILSSLSLQTDSRRKKMKEIYKNAGVFRNYYKLGKRMFIRLSDICLVRRDYEQGKVMSKIIRLHLYFAWRWYAYSTRTKTYKKDSSKGRSHIRRRGLKRALKALRWNASIRQKCRLVGRPMVLRFFIKYYHAYHSRLLMKTVINRMMSGYHRDMQRAALHEWRLDVTVSRRLEQYKHERVGEQFIVLTRKWMRRVRLNFRRKLRVARHLRVYVKRTVARYLSSLLSYKKLKNAGEMNKVKYDRYYVTQLKRGALTKIMLLWLAKKAFLQSELFEKRRLLRRLAFHKEMKIHSKADNTRVRLLLLHKAIRVLRKFMKKRFRIEFHNKFDHTSGAVLRCNVYRRNQRLKLLKLVDKWHLQRFGFMRLASVLAVVHTFKRFRRRTKKCAAYYERNFVKRAFKRLLANRRVRRKLRSLLQCTKKYSEKKAKMVIVRRLDIFSCFRFSERESARLISAKHATRMYLSRGMKALTISVVNKNKSFLALQNNISSIF